MNGNIITCPWHGWKYSVIDGKSPHEGGDSVDSYETTVFDGKVFINPDPANIGKRESKPHEKYAELEAAVRKHLQQAGTESTAHRKTRVLGISTTNSNDKVAPRPSTSEAALQFALDFASAGQGAETVMIKLRELKIKDCEGYYSKNPKACIFPCSISEMDENDQMIEIYGRMILWADVVIVASPIRWGSASSLYYKMIQRLNSVQNQTPTYDNMLIRDKVAAFIITGGQDNIQHVAGEMMSFWTQLGFVLGKFPFVGWSRGWYAEDTENNYDAMKKMEQFGEDIRRTIRAALSMSDLVRKSCYDDTLLKQDFQSTEAL
jgi:multimeric flavodoxin WrbA